MHISQIVFHVTQMSNGINLLLLMMIQILIHDSGLEAWGANCGRDSGALVTDMLPQCGEM